MATAALKARVFDRDRRRSLGENAKLVLLRASGEDTSYTVTETLEAGWNAKYSDAYDNVTFHVADTSADFAAKVRNASSHAMVIDSDLPALNNAVFSLLRETVPPTGDSPWWKLRGSSIGRCYRGGVEA